MESPTKIKKEKHSKYRVSLKEKLKAQFKDVTFKSFMIKGSIIVVSALVLAILITLTKGNYKKASDFFNKNIMLHVLNSAAILIVMLSTLYFYTKFTQKEKDSTKNFWILSTCVNSTFLLSILFSYLINVYIAPIALVALLTATLLDKKIGIVTSILSSQTYFFICLLLFGQESIIHSSAALLTSMIASIFLVMLLDKAKTRLSYIVTSLIVGVCAMFIPMIINLLGEIGQNPPLIDILMSGVWSLLSIVLSLALYTLSLPLLEKLFKVNTTFRMAELASLTNPILKRLSAEAPGTFNHSLVVGSLAELCADAIGEDTQLAKAAAYFHDIGKVENPEYYGENQKGYNPHDDIIPEVSVSMIINHATAGYEILKEARMPEVIVDVTREHHGTTPVNYFLYKAQGYTEEHIDSTEFRYPGPKPSTKIAAIIMIVDTVEAASRAMASTFNDTREFRKFINKLIKEKVAQDQFSECEITFNDLKIIEDVLVEAIPSMFHIRIKYVNPSENGEEEISEIDEGEEGQKHKKKNAPSNKKQK